MDKIYIVDAVNYLFRSYYAIGPMMNDKGESTSAVFGFIRSLQKLIKDCSPSHLVCVFDGPDNKKSRKAVYAEYKMNRKGAPEDLFPQFEWANEWCQMVGIPTLCVDGVEADDTMASIALWAQKKGSKVFLCSSDKDLAQLVNDQVFVLHTHKENAILDRMKVKEIFGVWPEQMLDYLAMVGDASDNIPGISGFGPKTAASLLEEFGTLDALLSHPEKVKGEKKQELLKSEQKTALMSRELATLNCSVEIPQGIDFYAIKNSDPTKLTAFYQRMKFLSLLREMENLPPPKKKEVEPPRKYHLIDDEKSLSALLQNLENENELCIDTETTDTSPMRAELVGIGLAKKGSDVWYIPFNGKLGQEKALSALKELFKSPRLKVFGHNIKYDLHVLQNAGFSLPEISFDTLVASYLLNPQSRRHNLDELTLEKFQKQKIAITDLIGKGKEEISMREVAVEKVAEYCCEDVDYTIRLKDLFLDELKERHLDRLLFDIELPLLPVLQKMERDGIYLDTEELRSISTVLLNDIETLKKEIFLDAKEEINLNSPKQLSELLFQKLGLKSPFRGKTEFSTSADVLEAMIQDHPIIPKILQYRMLEKLRSTYVEALPFSIHPKTGRIHCTFSQSVAATGRLSCQNPNLQNIPVRTKEGLAIRKCFKPARAGWSYLSADYSQIELRLLAHFSEDPELMRAFQSNQDIHTHTAALIYDIFPEMVTPEMRSLSKAVNFGIIYGQSPFGLSRQLGITLQEAAQFIQTYFERYPKVSAYLESCKESARKTGMATTLTGRQRPIPEITNKNPTIRSAAERLAVNTPLQGTQADLIKIAMIQIDEVIQERNLKGKMILQIHDELLFEIPDEEIPTFEKVVKEKMEQVVHLNIPLEVKVSVGKNWAAC